MKIKTKPLLAALKECGRTVPTRTTLPILEMVKLHGNNSHLTLESTSLDVHVTRTVPCEGQIDPLCVSQKILERITGFNQGEDTDIELSKRLVINGTSRTTLSVTAHADFPPAPEIGKPLAVNASDFADGLDAVSWVGALKKEDHRTNEITIRLKPKMLEMGAFAAIVFGLFERPLICESREFYLPRGAADVIASNCREPNAQLHLSDRHLSVIHDNGSVSALLSEKRFYDYDGFREWKRTLPLTIDKAMMVRATDFAIAVNRDTPNRSALIKFEFTGTVLNVSSTGTNNEFSETHAVASEPMEFSLDAALLMSCLHKIDAPAFALSNAETGVLFQSGDLLIAIGKRRG